jgi:retron-type reverse transcriptase
VKISEIWCATRRAVNINKNLCGCKSHTSQDADQLGGGAIDEEETKDQKLALTGEIYEADFGESSYGFRPEQSSSDALKAIKGYLKEGKSEVLDADLSKYFDTIPHDKLLIALKERISDPRLLDLIHQWLKAPIYEDGGFKGGKKKNKVGTPQGGVISP